MASPLDALRTEHRLIADLLDILAQEQRCLVGADTDGLAQLTPRKGELVQQMADSARLRHQQLGAEGFAADEAGMAAWVVQAAGPDASALWEQLLERTRDAKELNRVNGMLINKHLAHNHTLVNALRPADTPAAGLYGPSGQSTGGAASRRYVVG